MRKLVFYAFVGLAQLAYGQSIYLVKIFPAPLKGPVSNGYLREKEW